MGGGRSPPDREEEEAAEETTEEEAARERVRRQSRPTPTDGPGSPDPNPQSNVEEGFDEEQRRADALAERFVDGRASRGDAPGARDAPHPDQEVDHDPRLSPSDPGGGAVNGPRPDRDMVVDRELSRDEMGGGARTLPVPGEGMDPDPDAGPTVRDGSRPTGIAGPEDTPEPADGTGRDGSGGGRDGSRPTGIAGPEDTPEPVLGDGGAGSTGGAGGGRRGDRGDGPAPSTPADPRPRQGVEEFGDPAIREQASALEQRALKQTEGLDDPSEVRVVRQGDRLVAELTEEGRESLAERRSREVAAAVAPAAAAVRRDPGLEGQLVAGARQAARAVGRDPGRDVSSTVTLEGFTDDFQRDQAASRRTRPTGEQFGDFRLGIPGTDRTLEGVTRDAADAYRNATADLAPDQVLLPTGAGAVSVSTERNPVGAFAAGGLETTVAFGNVPATAVGLDEAVETGGFLVSETAQGRGGQALDDLEDAAEVAAVEAVETAQADPFRVAGGAAGSLVVSAGLIGGAARVSQTAGRATAVAIQPGEEIASAGLTRAFPNVARRFPGGRVDTEEAVVGAVRGARDRVRGLVRSDPERATDGGMDIPRMDERGQIDLGSLTHDEPVTLGAEDLDVERRGDPIPGERPRADEPEVSFEEVRRTRRRRERERDIEREQREMERIREATADFDAEAVLERERARLEEAERSSFDVEGAVFGSGVLAGRGADAAAGLVEDVGVVSRGFVEEVGLVSEADRAAVETGVGGALAFETGIESEVARESVFESALESALEVETETETRLESALEFDLGLEVEQEFEAETVLEFGQEFETELFGDRRDRTPRTDDLIGADIGRRLLEFDVAGFDELVGR